MGFLDNSTSNIVVDAVLTDLGRQLLAANNGSFSIRKFSLSDDEVDYGMITRFGTDVGKEKILKNTPIFEAQTQAGIAIKYNCVSLSAPAVTMFPYLSLSTGQTTSISTVSNVTTSKITITQGMNDSSIIPADLVETYFYVYVNSRFLRVLDANVDNRLPNGTSGYLLPATSATNGTTVTRDFTLKTVISSTSTDFTTYGDGTTIVTPVKIVGETTGITTDLFVSITK